MINILLKAIFYELSQIFIKKPYNYALRNGKYFFKSYFFNFLSYLSKIPKSML